MNGFADLGMMLTGGVGRAAEDEYIPRLRQNYNAYEALEDAKIKRSQAMARDSLPAAMERLGLDPALATVINASPSPSMNLLGNWQNPNYAKANQAVWANSGLDGGTQDLGAVALASAIANNKQLKTVDIDSGYIINRYDPNTAPQATNKTVADIGAINARAGASNASADKSAAGASLTRAKEANPDKYRAPEKPKKSKEDVYKRYKIYGGKKYGQDANGDWYEVK